MIITHTCREVGELEYGKQLIEDIRADEMLNELIGTDNLAKLKYYPTTTREDSPKMGRITDLMRSGAAFADLGVDPINPESDRAMVCGNLAFNIEIRADRGRQFQTCRICGGKGVSGLIRQTASTRQHPNEWAAL